MKIKILASASQDLIDGYRFYEKQMEGLGIYFLDTLFSDIDSLAIYGGIHPLYFKKYNRALSKRFPFAIDTAKSNTMTSLVNEISSINPITCYPPYTCCSLEM